MDPQAQPTTQKVHKILLCDAVPLRLSVQEDTQTGKLVVRGEFARAGAATENRRIYPEKLWEREIKRLEKALRERKVFGELDHPSDGRTMLARTSHIVTSLRIENGVVIGEAEVVDTEKGRDLKALLKASGKLGVSSRGYGSTRTNESGEEVVQDDYQLQTFDFVADPADQQAYPEIVSESKEGAVETEADKAKAEEWARRIESEVSQAKAETTESLRAEFAKHLIEAVAVARAEVTEQVRAELMADPALAGAKVALESVKAVLRPYVLGEDAEAVVREKETEIARLRNEVAERDLKIASLTEENDKLATLSKETGYRLFLERALSGDPDADLVRKLLGDVKGFANSAELKTKVESIRSDLATKRQNQLKIEENQKRELERAAEADKAYQKQIATLSEGLEKSVALNKEMALLLYAEKMLATHPHASKIRAVIERADLKSEADVDAIIENFRAPRVSDSETNDQVRARVRRLTGGGLSPTPLDEEAPPRAGTGRTAGYNGLGVDVSSIKELAGIRSNTTRNLREGGRR